MEETQKIQENSGQQDKNAEENPEQNAEKFLTAETVSAMITEAFRNFSQQQADEKSEAEKLAGMNAQQKAEYERDNLKNKLEELQQKIAVAEMQKTARSMLESQNLHIPESLLVTLVTADAETTKKNVEDFAQMYTAAIEEGVKARLKSGTPKTGKSVSGMTKSEILAIPDKEKRMRLSVKTMTYFERMMNNGRNKSDCNW